MDPQSVPDWRSASAYAFLARCGRPVFAWEWLRRWPAYRAAWDAVQPGANLYTDASAFGLHRFVSPDVSAPFARPIWTAEGDPAVLTAAATVPRAGDEPFDVIRLGKLARCHAGADGVEHWLFSDGFRAIRLDIVNGSLRAGPVHLAYCIGGLERAEPPGTTLLRLIALARTGRLAPTLFPPERRAPRWTQILRAHDAIMAGASHRELAAHLFELGELPRWRIVAPSYRRRAQRLAELARNAAKADPRGWLDGSYP